MKRLWDWSLIKIVVCMLVIGSIQDALLYFHKPAGTVYPFLLTTFYSKFYYLSIITQGLEGHTRVHLHYMLLPYNPWVILQYVYLFLGLIGRPLHMAAYQMFLVARVAGAILLLVSAILFIRRTLTGRLAAIAVFLYLFEEPLPFWNRGNIFAQDFGHWVWDTGEAVRRYAVLPPHITISGGLTVLSLLLFQTALAKKSFVLTIVAGLCYFVAGIVYPIPVFITGIALGLTAGIAMSMSFVHKRLDVTRFVMAGVFLTLGIVAVLLLQHESAKGFPWNVWAWEVNYFNGPQGMFWQGYLQQVGVFLPFAFIALFTKKPKTSADLFIRVWAFSGFFIAPFATTLRLGMNRIIQAQQILPLSILSAQGVMVLLLSLKRIAGTKITGFIQAVLAVSMLTVFAVYASLCGYQVVHSFWPGYRNVYIRPTDLEVFSYLWTHARTEPFVLAELYTANMLPGFAPVKTIIGYPPNYLNADDFNRDIGQTSLFLQAALTESEARILADRWHIGYVYARDSDIVSIRPYTFLTPVLKNDDVTLFAVRN